MSKLLMISLRDGTLGQQVAEAEYNDVLRATELSRDQIDHLVIADEKVELANLDDYAGVISGGSSLNVTNADDPADYSDYQKHVHGLLAEVVASGKPTFLICFGASWLAHHTGGLVSHRFGENTSGSTVQLTDVGIADPLCQGLPQLFTSMTGHTEAIEDISDDVQVLATGPTCPYQLLKFGDNVWASQFHLEMDAQALQTRMDFFMDYGYFSAADYDSIVASLPGIDTHDAHQLLKNFVAYCFEQS